MNHNNDNFDDKPLSALYKHTQQEMPPAQLDETIIAAARKQTRARPNNPFSNNWRVSASLVAVLVLGIGVVTLMETDLTPVADTAPTQVFAPAEIQIQRDDKLKKQRQQYLQQREKKSVARKRATAVAPPALVQIETINQLRLAGNIKQANQKLDEFIHQYFGDDINNTHPTQIPLSENDWQKLINEADQLEHKTLARKLKKLLSQRLKN